ncbi:AraC family transcriptional regulator [Paracoccus albus]|uniref:AraC family transcriptional regulator n=1 Tax=Paracoccus albus TaxID=3017784 RepID=UPI0022F0AA2A|nr:AraC family transcriptional regulator [Paracoccus albus]WBU62115.1 helix-turn-helix domain-containing protein [Paracoccus albus]
MSERRIIRIENLVTPKRRAFGILLHLHELDRKGSDTSALIRDSNLPAAVMSDPDMLIDIAAERRFLQRLLETEYSDVTPLEAGLAIGASTDISMFAPISNAAKFAGSCLEGLSMFLRFPELIWSNCCVAFGETDEEEFIEFVPETRNETLDAFSAARDMASTLGFIHGFYPDAPPPLSMDFQYDRDVTNRHLPDRLSGLLRFGRGRNELRMPKGFWTHRPITASAAMFRSLEMAIMRQLPVLRRQDRTSHLVTRQLRALEPIASLETVAGQLGLTARTLSRRLADEGVRFSALQDEVMVGRAKLYIRHSDLSLSQISDILGYSEPGAFTRAFKRVTGVSPKSWECR